MTNVDVCIATYRRPALLRRLLTSLAQQQLPPDVRMRLVVADNDAARSSQSVAEEFASSLPVIYDYEPERNISLARNRSISHATAEWIATIDDDATVAPDWIANLLGAAARYHADLVFGAVERRLPPNAPAYLTDSGIFQLRNPPTGTSKWLTYNTNNALIRRSILAGRPGPFDPGYGLTGGEDTLLFYDLEMRCNAKVVWCREAAVIETILPERANLAWRLRRSFREGTTYYRVYRKWDIRPDAPLSLRYIHLAVWCAQTCGTILWRTVAGVRNYESRLVAVRQLGQLCYNLGIAAQTAGFGYTEYASPRGTPLE